MENAMLLAHGVPNVLLAVADCIGISHLVWSLASPGCHPCNAVAILITVQVVQYRLEWVQVERTIFGART